MKLLKNKEAKKLIHNIRKFQTSLVLASIGLILVGAGLSINKLADFNKESEFTSSESANDETVVVDISGEVKNPGVYSLPSGTRVMEAIEAAGGVGQGGDKDWISKSLNLAEKVTDGQKILIPSVSQGASSLVTSPKSGEISGKININTASEARLDTLYGIGPVRAAKIIANRPYSSIEELVSKKVLGESTLEKIKDQITVY